jgi:hypothetical protein
LGRVVYVVLRDCMGSLGVGKCRGREIGVLGLCETDGSDVEIVGDAFFPQVKEGSKGLRVTISTM